MFATREVKKQTMDFALTGKKQNYKNKIESKRQSSNLSTSTHFLQRCLGNQATIHLSSNGIPAFKNIQPEKETDSTLRSTLHATKGSGKTLSEPIKTFMEASLATKLDQARVHTDSRAEVMTKSLGADAFTFGRNIFFNSGRYNPNTIKGAKLLAHELVHTVQQGFHDSQIPDHIPVSTPGEPMERQADSISTGIIENISGNQGNISKNVEGIKTQRIQPKIQMAKGVGVAIYETKNHAAGYEDHPSEPFKYEANSLKEAGNKLTNFITAARRLISSIAIKQLSFYGHAGPGDQSVGAGEGQDPLKQITVKTIDAYPDDYKKIYKPLANGADVYLRGCNAGAGPKGLALLKKVKSSCKSLVGTDIEAHGWTGKSYPMRVLAFAWYKQTGERVSSSDKTWKTTWEKLKKQDKGKK